VSVRVDGVEVAAPTDPAASLLAFLRYEAGLTVVKDGCSQGRCGACSVLVEDTLVTACTVLAADADGCVVTTAAGLTTPSGPSDLQRAFLDAGAVQCGFCTPGMVVAAHELLARVPHPSPAQVRQALAGNLCRCTGYGRIVAAVCTVAALRRSSGGQLGDPTPAQVR